MKEKFMKTIPIGASVVIMIGPSGSGKSTFIEKNFDAREVVSSDDLRIEFTGDIRRQDKNDLVFQELGRRVMTKLAAGQRVVIDATHLRDKDRKVSAEYGLSINVPVTYVVVNRSVEEKLKTGGWRLNVTTKNGDGLIEAHEQTFRANEKKILAADGLKGVQVVDTRTDRFNVATALSRDTPVKDLLNRGYNKVRVIGDVHGNVKGFEKAMDMSVDTFPLFLGDLLDYDAGGIEVVENVLDMVRNGDALSLRGNHEKKIARYVEVTRSGEEFKGTVSHGNDVTVNALAEMTPSRRDAWETKFLSLVDLSPDWVRLDQMLFVHGAAHPYMWDNNVFRSHRGSKSESLAMFGETNGKFEGGYPERTYNWIDRIPFESTVVVGHAILSFEHPVVKNGALGGTAVFLDTGSSKSDWDDGKKGFLSWADLDLTQMKDRTLVFGSEQE
jgi:predicted kinase